MFYEFDEELLHVISIALLSLYSLAHSVKPTRKTLDHLPTAKLAGANTCCNGHIGIASKLPHSHNVVITIRGQKILFCGFLSKKDKHGIYC